MVQLAKNEPKAFQEAQTLIEELRTHPKTGIGHPEPLKGKLEGRWSRRITAKHRLVYEVHDEEVIVFILTACGHYDDK